MTSALKSFSIDEIASTLAGSEGPNSLDILHFLRSNLPSEDQIEDIRIQLAEKETANAPTTLQEFFSLVVSIPRITKRVQFYCDFSDLPARIYALSSHLTDWTELLDDLIASDFLRLSIQTLLELGNLLNQGYGGYGNAKAFDLRSLLLVFSYSKNNSGAVGANSRQPLKHESQIS